MRPFFVRLVLAAVAVLGTERAAYAQQIQTKLINPPNVPYAITLCAVQLQSTPVTTTLQFRVQMDHARILSQVDTTVGEVTFVYSSGQTASRLISPLGPTTSSLVTLSSYGLTVTNARCALAFYNHPLVAIGVPEYLAPWFSPDWNSSLPVPPIPPGKH
jgi:hypothetical protein